MAKIGILNLTSSLNTGGVFHYIFTLLEGLKYSNSHEYILFYTDPLFKNLFLESQNIKGELIASNENILSEISIKLSRICEYARPVFSPFKALKSHKLDLLIDPVGSFLGFHYNIPYITVIYDLMHKYYPGFPEYSLFVRIIRDIIYKKTAYYSTLVVTDSIKTKDDLFSFYKIERDKIEVIPYCYPFYIHKYRDLESHSIQEVRKKYDLPKGFIFYPAQFWFHKNHLRLIEALYVLKDRDNVVIPAVFTGSIRSDSPGTFHKIKKRIKDLQMEDQILYLGYLSEEEIVAIYKSAVALIYPSLAGPTNIPPLEAMALGTPVACSELFSMPEQLGDAAIFFDPFDVNDMASKILKIWVDKNLRSELINRGHEKIKDMTYKIFATRLEEVIDEALKRIS